jgi:glycosyltransferase involved in cell wall biosynthesis
LEKDSRKADKNIQRIGEKMKIGFVTSFIDERGGGIGTYSYELIKNFNKKNEYYLIHHTPIDLDIYTTNHEILIKRCSLPFKGIIWRLINTPLKLKFKKKLDLVHDPYGIGPLSFKMPFKKVITIHDLTPTLFPHTFSSMAVVSHKLLLPRTLKTADKIITDSNSTKNDLINYFNIPEEKIRVILLAADEKFKPLSNKEIKEAKQKYSLNFPFILYVGTLEPRKNIPSLIKAFYKLKKKNLQYKLVIAGKRGWKYKEIFETIDKLNLQNDVVFTGYVSDEDLPALYNAADLFVYPSIYEGFGLPPLEAMACGTPAITSNTSSLPEVVGDAGIMVDPPDVDGLADAMYEVLTKEGLRANMIKKGLERAKTFSWEKCARETLEVYEEV